MHPFRLIVPNLISFAFLSVPLGTAASAQRLSGLEGFTNPYRDIHVGSSSTTTAIEVLVEEGDVIEQGQILMQLDDAVLRAAVEVAREAAVARGEREAAEQFLKTKQRRLEQIRELQERSHATAQELQMAEDERDEAAARLKAHDELIARREQELKRTEAELHRMTVRSPLDGIVVEIFRDIGEVISPAEPHLVRVVQLDPLKVVATGLAEHVDKLQKNEELSVLIGEQEHRAVVEYISPLVDAQSGMRKIHLRLPNPDNRIPSGIPCRVRVTGSTRQTPSKRNTASQQSMRWEPLMLPRTR